MLFLTEFRLLPTIINPPQSTARARRVAGQRHFPDSHIFAVIETLDSYFELRQLSAGLAGIIFSAADFAVEMALDPQRAAQQLRPIKKRKSA